MPVTTAIGGSIKSKVIRLTRLDSCGNPLIGATDQIVTAGYTKVTLKAQQEAGTEFLVRNAWGDFCINDLDGTRLKRYEAEIMMCNVDPSVIELTTGYRMITDATANNIGTAVAEVPGSVANGSQFALEAWTKVSGSACLVGGYKWIHWLVPSVRYAYSTDITIELTPLTITIIGTTLGNPNWGAGPYGQWVPNLGNTEHMAYQFTNTDPPAVTNGYAATTAFTGTPAAA